MNDLWTDLVEIVASQSTLAQTPTNCRESIRRSRHEYLRSGTAHTLTLVDRWRDCQQLLAHTIREPGEHASSHPHSTTFSNSTPANVNVRLGHGPVQHLVHAVRAPRRPATAETAPLPRGTARCQSSPSDRPAARTSAPVPTTWPQSAFRDESRARRTQSFSLMSRTISRSALAHERVAALRCQARPERRSRLGPRTAVAARRAAARSPRRSARRARRRRPSPARRQWCVPTSTEPAQPGIAM
jgi:hypothetical protein